MIKLILQSIRQTILWTVVTGIAYPLVITVIAQLAFHDQANGSLVVRDGNVVGSALIAQQFQTDKYFWPRPSAGGYATVPSGASNLGPTSAALQSNVLANAAAIRTANKLPADAPIPADLLFTSGSGLDPHISPAAARLQVARVAAARGVSADSVSALVEKLVEPPQWGFLGEARLNVLRLNLALDEMGGEEVMKRQGIQSLRSGTHMHRILVPVNFTDASIQAVEYAAKLARPLGATITVLHVADVNDFKSNRLGSRELLLKEAREAAEHKLHNFVKLFVGSDVVTETVVGVGKPVEQILYEIREMDPDMVVITTRYRKDTRWFWQRDTTVGVLKYASCPVSVMHDSGSDLTDLLFY